jgi:hypothetical protein
MYRQSRGEHATVEAGRWQPGRLLVGWSVGVLMTLGLLTATGGWYEYRELSTEPGTGSPTRRVSGLESACQVDKDAAVNLGGFEVVPDQSNGCYLRRPRIRPWQWPDGIRAELGRIETMAALPRRAIEMLGAGLPSGRAGASVAAQDGANERVSAIRASETAAP